MATWNYQLEQDCPFYDVATPNRHWCGRPCNCRNMIKDDVARAHSFEPGVARGLRHWKTEAERRVALARLAKLPAKQLRLTNVPVDKSTRPVHKKPVDSPQVSTVDKSVDSVDKRKAYKREWMRKRRETTK